MGMDTQLYLSNKWNKQDVADIIHNTVKRTIDANANFPGIVVGSTGCGNHYFLYYRYDEVGIGAIMVHESEIGGIPAILISMSFGESSVKFLRGIGERYGGMFIENDCDGSIESFDSTDFDDMEYTLKAIQVGGAYYEKGPNRLNYMIDDLIDSLEKLKVGAIK